MIFGSRPVAEAKNTILARDILLKDGERMAAGAALGAEEIVKLTMAGIKNVCVSQLEDMDVPADDAVDLIAKNMISAPDEANVSLSVAKNGCVQMIATATGVVGLDRASIVRSNSVDPSVSIITLPLFQRVMTGDVVAQVDIAQLSVPRLILSQVIELVQDTLRVRPVLARTASLIQTVISGKNQTGSGEIVIRERLERLGMRLIQSEIVAHNEDAIAEQILSAQGDVLLILTAVEALDTHDIGPNSIRVAGGDVTRFGMPIFPGRAMFAGGFGAVPILGLPDCARAPEHTGVDHILERLVCGVAIGDDDIADMAVGGLLHSIYRQDA